MFYLVKEFCEIRLFENGDQALPDSVCVVAGEAAAQVKSKRNLGCIDNFPARLFPLNVSGYGQTLGVENPIQDRFFFSAVAPCIEQPQ